MAAPSIPTNLYVTTGNRQVFTQWDIQAGATTYSIQRSTDGVTFSALATPAVNYYLDTTTSAGTQYWYQIASVSSGGTSSYTSSQSIIPAPSGEMSLGFLRLASQQRSDLVNSLFITLPEWNSYINQSYFELYDTLVTMFEDYFLAAPVTFITDGSTFLYDLPNGVNYSAAKPYYKLMGVDLALQSSSNAYVTINKFQFQDRNKFLYPNAASTIYGVFNMQYRVLGSQIMFIPTPSANQTIRLWYIPRLTELLADTDLTVAGISGWEEFIIIDAAIKAKQKQEEDTSVLMMQKQAIIKRIQDSAANRDAGMPDRITDIRSNGWWGSNTGGYGFSGPSGGF